MKMLVTHLKELISKVLDGRGSLVQTRSAQLDLEIFHGTYVAALSAYESKIKSSGDTEPPPMEEWSAVDAELILVLGDIFSWRPENDSLAVERLKFISHHALFCSRHEDILRQALAVIFQALATADTTPASGNLT